MLINRILRWAIALLSVRSGRLKLRAVRISARSSTRIRGRIVGDRGPFTPIIFGEDIVLNSRATLNSWEARGPVILKTNRPYAISAIGADQSPPTALSSLMTFSSEHDRWILKGVAVGVSKVVGAGSVVTNDVPPGSVVAGNPARFVGSVSRINQR